MLLLLLSLITIAENCTFQKIGKQKFSSPPQYPLHTGVACKTIPKTSLFTATACAAPWHISQGLLRQHGTTRRTDDEETLSRCCRLAFCALCVGVSMPFFRYVRSRTHNMKQEFVVYTRKSLSQHITLLSPCASENPIQLTLCNYRRGRAQV